MIKNVKLSVNKYELNTEFYIPLNEMSEDLRKALNKDRIPYFRAQGTIVLSGMGEMPSFEVKTLNGFFLCDNLGAKNRREFRMRLSELEDKIREENDDEFLE